jgi:hypothetical protein
LLLTTIAVVMVLLLLGKTAGVAEARAFDEKRRAAHETAKEARRVHERWRAARAR